MSHLHLSAVGTINLFCFSKVQFIEFPVLRVNSAKDETSVQVLPMSDELRRALYASTAPSLDIELSPPDLVGTTEILTDEHREALCRHLPARAEGYVWTLVFSTSQHGFSLNSMYRKMQRLESPILLVIQDTDNNVSCFFTFFFDKLQGFCCVD